MGDDNEETWIQQDWVQKTIANGLQEDLDDLSLFYIFAILGRKKNRQNSRTQTRIIHDGQMKKRLPSTTTISWNDFNTTKTNQPFLGLKSCNLKRVYKYYSSTKSVWRYTYVVIRCSWLIVINVNWYNINFSSSIRETFSRALCRYKEI